MKKEDIKPTKWTLQCCSRVGKLYIYTKAPKKPNMVQRPLLNEDPLHVILQCLVTNYNAIKINNPWHHWSIWETRGHPLHHPFMLKLLTMLGSKMNLMNDPWMVTLPDLVSCQQLTCMLWGTRSELSAPRFLKCDPILLLPNIPCLHYSLIEGYSMYQKVYTHSPSMFVLVFLQWWACGGEGNKYIGPVNGNDNKIWLIKLKQTKGL